MATPDTRTLLLRRGEDKTKKGQRKDPYHLALVLEGGGMRGIVSIGMASVFEDRGLFDAFDSVHGSSAGACAAAYFSSGQSHLGASIYYEDINNRTFIDLSRVSRLRPIMNVDFLIDEVMVTKKPLNVGAILNNPGFLNVVATDATSGEEVLFSSFRDASQLFGVLKGSICIPLIAGRSVLLDGRYLVDGGLVQQIALPSAISSGATHVIVLMTRRRSELERPTGGRRAALEAFALRQFYGKSIASLYRTRGKAINNVIHDVLSGSTASGTQVSGIAMPDDSVEIDRLTIDRDKLLAGLRSAREAASQFLE
jgi:predicted patatin/cPLA2 family phospholipase